MKLIIRNLLLATIYLLVVGCANVPAKLGVSELEWSSYSPEKQKKLLTYYEQIIKEQRRIGDSQIDSNLSNKFLAVSIYNGKIMFPPSFINWQKYKPVQFNILSGQCASIEMISQSNEALKTTLRVCFYDNALFLDPSRYELTKMNGSVRIHASPLWSAGFAYKDINSSGYVQFSNVTIEIKQSDNLPIRKTNM